MAYVRVKVRDAKQDEIVSPDMAEDEAKKQLAVIRSTLGTSEAPELDWLAVMGKDIISADLLQ